MNSFQLKALPAAFLALGLSACGGGGGGGSSSVAGVDNGPSQGISGSGATTSGTIDSFGSIFVNGVRYSTDDAEITINGERATEDDLGLGMVVLVKGRRDDDGVNGTAAQVIYDDEVEGPISEISTGSDGDSKLLTILGVRVIVERTGTVFDDTSFDQLAVGDFVEVSGYPEGENTIRATRLELETDFVPGQTEIEVTGVVSDLTPTTFNIGSFQVDYSNAELDDFDDVELADGLRVEVEGTVEGQLITAFEVEPDDDIIDLIDDDDDFSVQGTIVNYVGPSQFEVNGVRVNAGNAELEPSNLVLADGVVVEVEGRWNGTALVAQSVEARRGRVEIEAFVDAVDSSAGTVTMGLFGGDITVQVDSTTLLEDDRDDGDDDNLSLSEIRTGDFLEIEAIQNGTDLVATRIDLDDSDDEVLQGPVEGFNAGLNITILGITFSTSGAEFESDEDEDISSDAFYSQLQVGDLVKVTDEETPDGIADEVEFEFEGRQDGGFEFDEDDFDDEDDSEDEFDEVDEPDEPDEPDEVDELDEPDELDEIDEPDEPDEIDEPDEPDEPDSDDPTDDSSGSGSGSDDSSGSGSG